MDTLVSLKKEHFYIIPYRFYDRYADTDAVTAFLAVGRWLNLMTVVAEHNTRYLDEATDAADRHERMTAVACVSAAVCDEAAKIVENLEDKFGGRDYFAGFEEFLDPDSDSIGAWHAEFADPPFRLATDSREVSEEFNSMDLTGKHLFNRIERRRVAAEHREPLLSVEEAEDLRVTTYHMIHQFLQGASDFLKGLAKEIGLEQTRSTTSVKV